MRLQELARQAIAAAARVRADTRCDPYTAICVYDLVERLGIDLWFQALPSLEGMYSPGQPPIIIVSALRQAGRQRVNCAHELGHHTFGHGTRLDQLLEDGRHRAFSSEEFLADCFAEFLLMPKLTLLAALTARNIDPESCSPIELFSLANYFGVGYVTLLHHLEHNLARLSESRATLLRKSTPKQIRTSVIGHEIAGEMVFADRHWKGRPIDLHVGDVLVLPHSTTTEGRHLTGIRDTEAGLLWEATSSGLARAYDPHSTWATFVRIARRVPGGGFAGRSLYRYEEEPDD